jgi:hypothetical protein
MRRLRISQPPRSAISACFSRFPALLLAAILAFTQVSWASPIGGAYCGKAISNGEWVDVVTRLKTGQDGLLTGTYEFDDQGEMAPGTLRETSKASEDARVLTWVDRYGSGTVVLTFTPDRTSFRGFWGLDGDLPSLGWNGGSCEANIV